MLQLVPRPPNGTLPLTQGRSDGVDIGIYTPPQKKISRSKLFMG